METRIKSYIKKKDKSILKEKESYKILRVTQNIKPKKEKEKNKDKENEKEKEKREGNFKAQRNLKNNKSMTGVLSDSETIKTETTRGDTLTENNKNKYVYRKSVNKKNFSFAIKNFLSGKNTATNYSKKNRLNYSMSLNKFLKDNNNYNTEYSSNSHENILNTNHNFYRKQSNLLDKYRTNNNPLDINNSLNLYNDKSFKFFEKDNFSSLYDRSEEFINIEDLLILEEKFSDVLISVKSKHNTPNECFELLNSYQQSSIYNNFENYFKDIVSKAIVHSGYYVFNI